MSDFDFAYRPLPSRNPSAWLQRAVTLWRFAGPRASYETLLAATDKLVWLRREQLARLLALGWAVAPDAAKQQYVRNCPPGALSTIPPSRPCGRALICPFCTGREAADTWHLFRQLLRREQIPRDDLVLWEYRRTQTAPALPPEDDDRPPHEQVPAAWISRIVTYQLDRRSRQLRSLRQVLGGVHRTSIEPMASGGWRVRTGVLAIALRNCRAPSWMSRGSRLRRRRRRPRRSALRRRRRPCLRHVLLATARVYRYPIGILLARPEHLMLLFQACGFGYVREVDEWQRCGVRRRRLTERFGLLRQREDENEV